jgi:UDP-N-acetylmuramoylalanine--D-glutamate ligase
MAKQNWQNRKIVILGAARQGLALARYLNAQGARVTLSDMRSPEELAQARQSLSNSDIQWVLGEHPSSLLDQADLLCLSGGIPLDLPIVIEAQRRGVALSNDSQIFMQAVSSPIIGITGSAGKTTTTTLVGRVMKAFYEPEQKVWVGGNIGLPLIDKVDEIQPADRVVLELSSFQLEQMTMSPQIAAVLNITPNHLDRHGTLEAYTNAKARILDFQPPDSIAVLNREDMGSWNLRSRVKGELVSFGLRRPHGPFRGSYIEDGWCCLQTPQGVINVCLQESITLRGEHNLLNVLAAFAICEAAGCNPQAMTAGVQDFKGVSHRLEFIREFRGAKWYNDSIATAPERSMAAIRSFSEPLLLLLGGRDKNLPWQGLSELVAQRVDQVIIFGEAAPKILQSLQAAQNPVQPLKVRVVQQLQDAVIAAAEMVKPGSVVLLSPGGTSFDEFKDFEERGERYCAWVNQLT